MSILYIFHYDSIFEIAVFSGQRKLSSSNDAVFSACNLCNAAASFKNRSTAVFTSNDAAMGNPRTHETFFRPET